MLKYAGDKKPAQWRASLCVAVFSPANPDSAALEMLYADAARLLDLLKDLLPCFSGFCFKPGDRDGLDLLDARRSNQALDASANQFI
jgi:hypothetical protein